MNTRNKVFILGLDCLDPDIIFNRYRKDLPNLNNLLNHSRYGRLQSTVPPVTVPAWMAMMTGRDPGKLGFYGFRDRSAYDYRSAHIVNSTSVNNPTLWDYAGSAGKKSTVLGVPQTYPPRPINGILVASFLTPSKELPFTYPADIKEELESIGKGEYIIDLENFRNPDKDALLRQIYAMTEKRFAVINRWIEDKEWDLFIAVEMAPDRLHHAFWQYCNADHPLYEEGNQYEEVFLDYYRFLDRLIGELISGLEPETRFLVVSDHGAQSLRGTFFLNDWLISHGYLTLKTRPERPAILSEENVDWEQTRVWAEGGYYGKIFFNIKGREPRGILPPKQLEEEKKKLSGLLRSDKLQPGEEISGTRIFDPEKIYSERKNIPPDLIVYLGNLSWRINGTVGNSRLSSPCGKDSPDNANHAQEGVFILSTIKKGRPEIREKSASASPGEFSILDVAPTVLNLMGIEGEKGLKGKIIEPV